MAEKKKVLKRVLLSILAVFLALIVVVVSYLGYVVFSYSRIEDKQALTVSSIESEEIVHIATEYTIVTQNIGFGAYTKDFTFFMDGGTESRAKSKESVISCIEQGATEIKSFNPDFVLFQEVDTDSTRSHHTNQHKMLTESFVEYSSAFAINYHSA